MKFIHYPKGPKKTQPYFELVLEPLFQWTYTTTTNIGFLLGRVFLSNLN
jgi:hypothetical protein